MCDLTIFILKSVRIQSLFQWKLHQGLVLIIISGVKINPLLHCDIIQKGAFFHSQHSDTEEITIISNVSTPPWIQGS